MHFIRQDRRDSARREAEHAVDATLTGSVVSVDQMTSRVSINAAPKDDCCAGGIS